MVNAMPVTGLHMAKQDARGVEKPKTEGVRLTAETVGKLREIVEARGPGWSLAAVVDELLEGELPAVHAAAVIRLRKIRAIQAEAAAAPKGTRRPVE